jgi:hypothetical protein
MKYPENFDATEFLEVPLSINCHKLMLYGISRKGSRAISCHRNKKVEAGNKPAQTSELKIGAAKPL